MFSSAYTSMKSLLPNRPADLPVMLIFQKFREGIRPAPNDVKSILGGDRAVADGGYDLTKKFIRHISGSVKPGNRSAHMPVNPDISFVVENIQTLQKSRDRIRSDVRKYILHIEQSVPLLFRSGGSADRSRGFRR